LYYNIINANDTAHFYKPIFRTLMI